MRCPFCSAEKNHLNVIDSRTCEGGRSIRRRRQCEVCHKRFTTYERIEETTRLLVVKKNGERKPWDKDKIIAGLERACYKRSVPESELLRIADEVEEEVKGAYDREVPASAIGELVTDKLRRVDQVAYVRYASVYREFKTLEDLVEEAKAVLDARRYEDPPGQGRLFIEPPVIRAGTAARPARAGGTNGASEAAAGSNGAAAPNGDAAHAAATEPRRRRGRPPKVQPQ
jgi:transcriptional repressor NrdR